MRKDGHLCCPSVPVHVQRVPGNKQQKPFI
jgi:hypothetical protein